jgi:endo-1,4-beta-xylanase
VKREWWLAPTTTRSDEAGRVSVRGWAGEYAVRRAGSAGTGTRFTVQPDQRSVEVSLSE